MTAGSRKQCHRTAGPFVGRGWQCSVDNFPSFLLIKDMPNSIGEIFFCTLINRMIMMDELMPTLCLGPSDTEETHQYLHERPTHLWFATRCGSDVFVDINLQGPPIFPLFFCASINYTTKWTECAYQSTVWS